MNLKQTVGYPVSDMSVWAVTPESTAQTNASLADYKAGRAIGVKDLDRILARRRKKTRKPALP